MGVLATTVGGGLGVPSRISYDVAPADCQLRFGLTVTQIAPFGGFGEFGTAGPGGGGAVVNDQIGPVVSPPLLCATICQKYVVLLASAGGAYEAAD